MLMRFRRDLQKYVSTIGLDLWLCENCYSRVFVYALKIDVVLVIEILPT